MRYALGWLCLLLCMLAAVAQGPEQGQVQATIVFDDGTPYRHLPVTVTVGDVDLPFMTEDDGTFAGLVPAGEAIITAATARATIQIVAGQTTAVRLVVQQVGTIIKMTVPEGLEILNTRASVRAGNAAPTAATAMPLTNNRFWVPEATGATNALAIVITYEFGRISLEHRMRWAFTKAEERRTVTGALPKPEAVTITVQDINGKSQPEALIQASITLHQPFYRDPFWDDNAFSRTRVTMPAPPRPRTDTNGQFLLGALPPGTYEITLASGKFRGAPLALTLPLDTNAPPLAYTLLAGNRTVTQTVFTTDGKPAANTDVSISYVKDGEIQIRHASTDAGGKVVWAELPVVPALVWGPQVPVGVLPAHAVTVTAPLQPLSQKPEAVVRLMPEGLGPQAGQVTWHIATHQALKGANTFEVRCGESMAFVGRTAGATPWVAAQAPFDMPPVEGVSARLRVPFALACTVQGKFVSHDGKPVTGVSQLGVLPTAATLPGIPNQLLIENNLLQAALYPDGTFILRVPAPGRYRLQVDLYDAHTPTPPSLLLDVKAGDQQVTVTLPKPLLTVPAGAELTWVTRATPFTLQKMVVNTLTPQAPVYGDPAQVLASWYQPAPETLAVRDAQGQLRTLKRRTVYLRPRDAAGDLLTGELYLAPVLPGFPPIELKAPGYQATLWSGIYATEHQESGLTCLLEIPPAGPAEIPVICREKLVVEYPGTLAQPTQTVGASFSIYFPSRPPLDPMTVTLRGVGETAGKAYNDLVPSRHYLPLLNRTVAQLTHILPGAYTMTVHTKNGPVTAEVEVTESGGWVELDYPKGEQPN